MRATQHTLAADAVPPYGEMIPALVSHARIRIPDVAIRKCRV